MCTGENLAGWEARLRSLLEPSSPQRSSQPVLTRLEKYPAGNNGPEGPEAKYEGFSTLK